MRLDAIAADVVRSQRSNGEERLLLRRQPDGDRGLAGSRHLLSMYRKRSHAVCPIFAAMANYIARFAIHADDTEGNVAAASEWERE
jgi:hypothetical protein